MQQVLVLNASYEPLNVCSVRRAHVLVHKQKAELVEVLDRPLRSAETTFSWPHVVRLRTYVRVPRGVTRRISRRAGVVISSWSRSPAKTCSKSRRVDSICSMAGPLATPPVTAYSTPFA